MDYKTRLDAILDWAMDRLGCILACILAFILGAALL